MAWALALTFGLRSVVFQGLLAWLPTIYVERGWDEVRGGSRLLWNEAREAVAHAWRSLDEIEHAPAHGH